MKTKLKVLTIATHLLATKTNHHGNVMTIENRGKHLKPNNLIIETKKKQGYTNTFLEKKQRSERRKKR